MQLGENSSAQSGLLMKWSILDQEATLWCKLFRKLWPEYLSFMFFFCFLFGYTEMTHFQVSICQLDRCLS